MSEIDELVDMSHWEAHRGHPFWLDYIGELGSQEIRAAKAELTALRASLRAAIAAKDAEITRQTQQIFDLEMLAEHRKGDYEEANEEILKMDAEIAEIRAAVLKYDEEASRLHAWGEFLFSLHKILGLPFEIGGGL
jgi:hypothetical protein